VTRDTIAAVATPPGEGGVAIIRISGPGAREILSRAFSPAPKQNRRLTYGRVVGAQGAIDEAMAVFLPAPHTYTREDVAEIHCHGGEYITRRVLERAFELGARAAKPGEFTLRAFLNGRVTLDEAEAVMGVVSARSEAAGRAALRQLEGGVSAYVRGVRAQLVDQLAEIEAHLDFPEEIDEELTRETLIRSLEEILAGLRERADGARARIVRDVASETGWPTTSVSPRSACLPSASRSGVHDGFHRGSPSADRSCRTAESLRPHHG